MKRERMLLIVPAAVFVLAVLLVNVHGPYYLGRNFDPEYCYLLNALSILDFYTPGHTDHPGTTVQLLGAGVLLVKWLFTAALGFEAPLDISVLSHPEDYLRAINLTLNLLVCGLLFLTARTMLRATGSLVPALGLQVGWLVFVSPLEAHLRVSPEPLLMAVVLAMALVLIPVLFGGDPGAAARLPRTAWFLGAVYGFGVVTKVTFVPLAALALVLPGWRQKGRFATAAAVSGALLLMPIWSQLGSVARWLLSLATHTGRYGSGRAGLPTLKEYADNIHKLLMQEPFIFVFFVFFAGLVPLSVFLGRRISGDYDETLHRRWWLGAAIATGALIAVTAKHPAAHYMLPVTVLAPVSIAVLAERVRTRIRRRGPARLLAGGSALLVVAGLVCHAAALEDWIDSQYFYRDLLARQRHMIRQMPDCQVIGLYRSSVPTFALDFGNNYADWKHSETLRLLSPDHLSYSAHWGGYRKFQDFTGESREDEVTRRLEAGDCLLVQGNWLAVRDIIGYRFEPLSPTDREEVLIRLTSVAQTLEDYTAPPGSLVLEAEQYTERDNVWAEDDVITSGHSNAVVNYRFDLPEAGRRELLLRYTSGGGRALRVRLNGEVVTESAATARAEEMVWERIGDYEFAAGSNELQLERDGWFPRIDRIVVAPIEEADAAL